VLLVPEQPPDGQALRLLVANRQVKFHLGSVLPDGVLKPTVY